MAQISSTFRQFLDRTLPKPVEGPGYQVQFASRSAIRYIEGLKQITMFNDFIERTNEPWYGGIIDDIFSKWCLGIYIEEPLVWDNETTAIPADHAALILQRVEAALQQRLNCYRIDRGPNQQHFQPKPVTDNFFKRPVRWRT